MAQEKKLLNVGFVFDDSLDSFDGVSQYVKTLGAWLRKQGHEVSYLVGETKLEDWAGGKVYSLSKNKNVSFNKNKLSIPVLPRTKQIKKVLEDNEFDVLHVQVPYSPFMSGKIIKGARPDTAVIGTFHILPANNASIIGSKLLGKIYGRQLDRFDKFFSVSPPAAEFAKKALGIDSEILPNVVDSSKYQFTASPSKKEPTIVFLGRLVKRKGCEELLKAFRLAVGNGLEARLLIAGAGPERKKLEQFVADNNLSGRAKFLGFIREEDKPGLFANCDIACFPSTGGESFGIVLIEAMAAGARVVLGGDNPGYRSVLGGRKELLIDPKNTELFAEKLQELIDDEKKSASVSQWLSEEIKKYDVNTVGIRLEQAYLTSIAKRRKSIHNVDNG